MNERTLHPAEARGPLPGNGIFDDGTDSAGLTSVTAGLHTEQIPVAGMSVGEIRTRYRDLFNIDPQSRATLEGRDVDDGTIVRAGQVLIFSARAGEKGRARVARPGPPAYPA